MKISDFLKKQKIKKLYSYHEEDEGDSTRTFGWVISKTIDLNNPVVISTSSKSKKVIERDRAWAKREGNSAASVSDYNKYFLSLTGESPREFLDSWENKVDSLEAARSQSNERYREGEGMFLVDLANLLENNKKFARFGRIYKIIDPST
jgi:hypothetical protein